MNLFTVNQSWSYIPMSYSNRLRKFNNSTSSQERLSTGVLLLEEVHQLGYPVADLCDYLLVLAISEVPSDLAIANWERAFAEFSHSTTDADRLRWGQCLVRAGYEVGKDVSAVRLYLSELTHVNSYTNSEATVAELEAKLYAAESAAWEITHDYRTQDLGNRPCLYQAQEASTKEWGDMRFYKDVIKADRDRKIAIKRRARRAAKYN
jgi:hypothetical protein